VQFPADVADAGDNVTGCTDIQEDPADDAEQTGSTEFKEDYDPELISVVLKLSSS
jgi:hypothetical protein